MNFSVLFLISGTKPRHQPVILIGCACSHIIPVTGCENSSGSGRHGNSYYISTRPFHQVHRDWKCEKLAQTVTTSRSLFGVHLEPEKGKVFVCVCVWGGNKVPVWCENMNLWKKAHQPEIFTNLKESKAWWENLASLAIEETATWLPPHIIT